MKGLSSTSGYWLTINLASVLVFALSTLVFCVLMQRHVSAGFPLLNCLALVEGCGQEEQYHL